YSNLIRLQRSMQTEPPGGMTSYLLHRIAASGLLGGASEFAPGGDQQAKNMRALGIGALGFGLSSPENLSQLAQLLTHTLFKAALTNAPRVVGTAGQVDMVDILKNLFSKATADATNR